MSENLIPPHGGYQELISYRTAEIIYDGTVHFCERLVDRRSRTTDQMIQAARSGKQNIAEGSTISGTSKKLELNLVSVARASLEELLNDYKDYLRVEVWDKEHPKAVFIRKLAYVENRSYATYKTYVENKTPQTAANTMICLVNQANYLLDRQIAALEKHLLEEGGFSERLYRMRLQRRDEQRREEHTNKPHRPGKRTE